MRRPQEAMPCFTLPGDSCQHTENRNLPVDRNRSQGVQGETAFLGDSEWKVKTPGCTREESKQRTDSPSPRTAPHPLTAWNQPCLATSTIFWPRSERRKHPERETDKLRKCACSGGRGLILADSESFCTWLRSARDQGIPRLLHEH